jgi:hypothetical protein
MLRPSKLVFLVLLVTSHQPIISSIRVIKLIPTISLSEIKERMSNLLINVYKTQVLCLKEQMPMQAVVSLILGQGEAYLIQPYLI